MEGGRPAGNDWPPIPTGYQHEQPTGSGGMVDRKSMPDPFRDAGFVCEGEVRKEECVERGKEGGGGDVLRVRDLSKSSLSYLNSLSMIYTSLLIILCDYYYVWIK